MPRRVLDAKSGDPLQRIAAHFPDTPTLQKETRKMTMLRHFSESREHPRDPRIQALAHPLPPKEYGPLQRFDGPGGFFAVLRAAYRPTVTR